MADTDKFFLQKKLLTRESLEIRKHNSVKNGYNDPQLYVDTKAWDPLLEKLRKKDKKKPGYLPKQETWRLISLQKMKILFFDF